jgi:hypothetical protein
MIKWGSLINRFTNNVQDATECLFPNWDSNYIPSVTSRSATHQPFSTIHRNTADSIFAEVLSNFEDQIPFFITNRRVRHLQCIIDGWQRTVLEFNINNCSEHLRDLPDVHRYPLFCSVNLSTPR